MNGIEGIEILEARYPQLLILVLTVYDDERIFDALCAGASGYLLKKTPPARLLDSIRVVGRLVIGSALIRSRLQQQQSAKPD